MNISYQWLNELTPTTLPARELAERLTMVGLTVDAVHQVDDDQVIEIDLTSNRPDCLSHLGVAREVATIESGRVILPKISVASQDVQSSGQTTVVEIRDVDLCPRYAARVIRGVRVAPSPAWLVKRLNAIGQRPINNIADITNYVMHELGQPLHAFDLATLTEQRIVVRRADAGETLKTLDGVERKLGEEMLVIADAARPVAVAGVMGGEETEISAQTRDVLIESAYFNPESVRRTSRSLNLRTEASARFERGVDYEGVMRALDRCVSLIVEMAGGTPDAQTIDVYPREIGGQAVGLRPARVGQLTGLKDISTEQVRRILTALGFESVDSSESTTLKFIVPTWRVDVTREEDLVEEVARHIGYDKIESALPGSSVAGEYNAGERRRRAARLALVAQGYNEAINFSFISQEHDNTFAPLPTLSETPQQQVEFVTLRNPIIEGLVRMRPTLLPGLLEALQRNFNQGTRDVSLFEMGRVFAAGEPKPNERESLALLATGGLLQAGRSGARGEVDFFEVKGALEAAIEAMHLPALSYEAAQFRHLREGQSAVIKTDGKVIGSIGRLSETFSAAYKFRQPVYLAELDLGILLAESDAPVRYQPLPRQPGVIRDISLLLDRRFTLAEITETIIALNQVHLRDVSFVDVYEGAHLPDGQRSLTLRLEYRADERSLRDAEVDELQSAVLRALGEKHGAQLRQ